MQRTAAIVLGSLWASSLAAQFHFQQYTSTPIVPQHPFDPARSLQVGGFNGVSGIAFNAIDWQSDSTAWVQTTGLAGFIPVELDDSQFASDSVQVTGLNAMGLLAGRSFRQGLERPVLGLVGQPLRAVFDDPSISGNITGISANSDVAVGTARIPNGGGSDVRGFVVRGENVSLLEVPAGASSAIPRGVSPNGDIIAGIYTIEGVGVLPALWINEVFTPLPMTSGTPDGMFATSVNDSLEVSGHYDPIADIPYARMWTYENGQHEAHLAASGWEWWPASGIDGDGVAAAFSILGGQDPILYRGDEFVSINDQILAGPSVNGLNIIHNSGSLIGSQGIGEYVLIRPVPSPGAALALIGGLGLARRRVR